MVECCLSSYRSKKYIKGFLEIIMNLEKQATRICTLHMVIQAVLEWLLVAIVIGRARKVFVLRFDFKFNCDPEESNCGRVFKGTLTNYLLCIVAVKISTCLL